MHRHTRFSSLDLGNRSETISSSQIWAIAQKNIIITGNGSSSAKYNHHKLGQ
jgi:hypothetical protein